MATRKLTTLALAALLALPLGAYATPINTRGADAQLAGRCKLMAYGEDRTHVAVGLIPMIVTQSNVDQRRQEIYDSCVAAGGGREQPAEMP
jgi:hypothetical protein